MQLQGKTAVVTGAGRGIGRALSERFAREGASGLVLADLNEESVHQVARDIAQETGVRTVGMKCDVAAETDIQRVVAAAIKEFSTIDLFCANAGIAESGGVELENERWEQVMRVNLMSHVYSSRAVLPAMIARGSGYLLHVASAAGLLTSLGSASYAASKHAALGLAEWLAITHYDQGIRVSCLCPMGVFTDMIASDEPAIQMLRESAITTDQLADAVVEGLEREEFLIAPHAQAVDFFRFKAQDYSKWLAGMQQLQQKLDQGKKSDES